MSKNKTVRGLLTAAQIIIYFIFGVVIWLEMNFGLSDYGEVFKAYIILLAVIFFSAYFQVIVHEIGHLAFGLMSGYKFSSFRVSSFTFIKTDDGRIKLKLMRVPGTSGQCLLIPPEPKNGLIPQKLYNMGGVIMNLIASAVSLTLKYAVGISGILGFILLGIGMMGASFALTNGVPMRSKLICNDGMNAKATGKDPEANRAFYNTLMLAWYQSKGYRMKDIPPEYFRFPSEEGLKDPIIASEAVFVIDRAIDCGFFEEADEMIDTVMREGDGINGLYMKLLRSDKLYISLILGKPIEYIESLLDKDMRKLLKALPMAMFGVYTAYAYEKLYLGATEKAVQIRSRFEKKAATYPLVGELETAKELMDKVDIQWNIWHGFGKNIE